MKSEQDLRNFLSNAWRFVGWRGAGWLSPLDTAGNRTMVPGGYSIVKGCLAGAGRRAGWATGCRGRSVHWQQCGASGAPVVPVKMNTYVSDKIHCTFIQRRVPVLCSVWGGGKGDSEKRMFWFLIALLQLKGWCAQAGGGHTSRRHIITIYIYI